MAKKKKKVPFFNILIASLLALLTVLSGFLGSIASNNLNTFPIHIPLPPIITSHLQSVWLWFLVVTLLYIAFSVWYLMRQSRNEPETAIKLSEPRKLSQEQWNRQQMLNRVRSFWISGVLEQSLYEEALIELGLQEQPDAVENLWPLILHETHKSPSSPQLETSIEYIYEESNGQLLILGEPGSGKTTLLLKLARYLLEHADINPAHPIPVVFNLSSWAVKRQPLNEWLVEELNTKYQIPRKISQVWVDTDEILPLLDGLDEVTLTWRSACIDAINDYRQEHGLVPIVIASRANEYLNQSERLQLYKAVFVQPLTEQQINDYLLHIGEQVASVRAALRRDKTLRALVTTPLMLNVLIMAYHGKSLRDIMKRGSPRIRRQQVLEAYIQRMLQRRTVETRYTPQKTIYWLAFLARQMVKQDQTVLYIERMQKDWLPDRQKQVFNLYSKLFFNFVIGLSYGWCFTLFFGSPFGLIGMLLVWIFFVTPTALSPIKPNENLIWSRQKLRRIFLSGLLGGGFWGMITGIISGPIAGLIAALAFGLFGGSLFGLRFETLDRNKYVKPNQGIWNSGKNGLFFGLSIGLILVLASGLTNIMLRGLKINELILKSSAMLCLGLNAGLVLGGVAFFKHFILRWSLWRAGLVPWNYARFLDYAVEHIFLRKVGGGYIFVHRLLLEHFASPTIKPAPCGFIKNLRSSNQNS